jgi:hypothetical protein
MFMLALACLMTWMWCVENDEKTTALLVVHMIAFEVGHKRARLLVEARKASSSRRKKVFWDHAAVLDRYKEILRRRPLLLCSCAPSNKVSACRLEWK